VNETLRRVYLSVFKDTPEGPVVLSDILNELGYFSQDPAIIKPECIAVANIILSKCGIFTANTTESGLTALLNLSKERPKDD
jgi:hypothetical protein